MAFNISQFNSVVNKKGLALNNLFVARIQFPLFNFGGILGSIAGRDIPFFCRSVQLPDMEVQVTDIKVQGYGTPHRRAVGMNHGILPMVFMVDADFNIKKLFHAWNQSIYNHGNGGSVLAGVDGRKIYELNYKDDYSAQIEVLVYSFHSEQIQYRYAFNGAFPTTVGGVQVAWENAAEIMTIPVQFAYDSISVQGAEFGSMTGLGSGSGFLGVLDSINNIGRAVNQLSIPRNIDDLLRQTNNVGTILANLPGANR